MKKSTKIAQVTELKTTKDNNNVSQQHTQNLGLAIAGLNHSELINLCCQSADHPAWIEFYRRFDKWIKTYLKKALRGRPALQNKNICFDNILSDLAQDVYFQLIDNNFHKLRLFKGGTDISFLAYLSRLVTNLVNEYFRKLLAIKRSGNTISGEVLNKQERAEDSPIDRRTLHLVNEYLSKNKENIVENMERAILFREAVDNLDKILTGENARRDKLIYHLYIIEGYSTAEIAAKFSFNLKTTSIESICRRIRAKLEAALSPSHKQAA